MPLPDGEQASGIHATTTQVLGGLFSGHNPKWSEREDEVIRLLITESSQYEEKPTKSQKSDYQLTNAMCNLVGHQARQLEQRATQVSIEPDAHCMA